MYTFLPSCSSLLSFLRAAVSRLGGQLNVPLSLKKCKGGNYQGDACLGEDYLSEVISLVGLICFDTRFRYFPIMLFMMKRLTVSCLC